MPSISRIWSVISQPISDKHGQVNIKLFNQTLQKAGYRGPLFIEREVGDQQQRFKDIAAGVRHVKECPKA
jgi:hypothetical protein